MKSRANPFDTHDFSVLKTESSKQVIKHILSPLEAAALRNDYTPFTFKINGTAIYISGAACKRLITFTTQKAELLNWAIIKNELSKDIPYELREVFDDPRLVLSLHPSLRNRLCRLECYTLFSIMKRGRAYFITNKFGKRAIQIIEELFTKHKCNNLFK